MERAKENGILLSGKNSNLELIENEIVKTHKIVSIEEFWEGGGEIVITLTSCDCKLVVKKRGDFPKEDLPCDCKKNMFVKYREDVTIVDLNELKDRKDD